MLTLFDELDALEIEDGALPTWVAEKPLAECPCPPIRWIRTARDAEDATRELLRWQVIGFDVETLGLDARQDRIRLMQFGTPDYVYLLDTYDISPKVMQPLLDTAPMICGHNLAFECEMLFGAGMTPPDGWRLVDTMLIEMIIHAGGLFGFLRGNALDAVAARRCGIRLDKSYQKSDWSGTLTPGHHRYAAQDAVVVLPILQEQAADIFRLGLGETVRLECRALPAFVWMRWNGVKLDYARWQKLAEQAAVDQAAASAELTTITGTAGLFGDPMVNWGSPPQVKKILHARKHKVLTTDANELVLLDTDDPFIPALLRYRNAAKRLGTYGENWAPFIHPITGRIHPNYRQMGTRTGRSSCAEPNIQNIKRESDYRAAFVPEWDEYGIPYLVVADDYEAPDDVVMIKADYSQIELRIAAVIAQDPRMLQAYLQGEDLHRLTAQTVLGAEEIDGELRRRAKAVNFGFAFGMGAKKFRLYAQVNYDVRLTDRESAQFKTRYLDTYTGLRRWHKQVGEVDAPITTRTLIGRLRSNVAGYSEKLNTPVQGSAGDGMKYALALCWERRDECPQARPVLNVHDELVIETRRSHAAAAKEWLTRAMVDGMRQVFTQIPVEVEATVGQNWSMKG